MNFCQCLDHPYHLISLRFSLILRFFVNEVATLVSHCRPIDYALESVLHLQLGECVAPAWAQIYHIDPTVLAGTAHQIPHQVEPHVPRCRVVVAVEPLPLPLQRPALRNHMYKANDPADA